MTKKLSTWICAAALFVIYCTVSNMSFNDDLAMEQAKHEFWLRMRAEKTVVQL